MMRFLALIRHGEAELWAPTDFERPLSDYGKQQCSLLGKYIQELNLDPFYVVSSPAKRTQQTSQLILNEQINYSQPPTVEEALYNCNVKTIENTIANIDSNIAHLAIVGHNNAISDLVTTFIPHTYLSTTGIVILKQDADAWSDFLSASPEIFLQIPQGFKP